MLTIILTKEGGWYATRDGKHLTAKQTARAIMKGEHHRTIKEEQK